MATKKKKTSRRRATLRLDAAFYPGGAVRKAQEAFAHLATIQVRKDGRNWAIRFEDMGADVADRLPDEFGNYALGCAVVEA